MAKATYGVRNKLREVKRVLEENGGAVPTSVVEGTELARNGINASRKNAALTQHDPDVQAILDRTRAEGCTMHGRLEAEEE